MYRKYERNFRHCNNCSNCSNANMPNCNVEETLCDNVMPEYALNNCNECLCGFDEVYNQFPENPMYGQSYVPIQQMDKTFIPKVGLKMGTIFPELVSPYSPGQSMCEIAYIASTNSIKEGCNNV